MMVCLILTHDVNRIYHKSCWRQLSYCGLHVRFVIREKIRCGLRFFGVFLCAVLWFSHPPYAPPPLNYSQIPFKKYKVIASIAPNRLYPGYQSFFSCVRRGASAGTGRRHERRSREKNLGSREPWFTVLYGPWPCLQSVNQTGGRKTDKLIQK